MSLSARNYPRTRLMPHRSQRGAALLVTMLVLLVFASTVLLARVNSRVQIATDDPVSTGAALSAAKEALIAYAVADQTRAGELPCPDFNNDGTFSALDVAGAACRSRVGWLPFRHLSLPPQVDGTGTPIWYAVSLGFTSPDTGILNSDTPGELTLDGDSDIVALLIAPGVETSTQDRSTVTGNASVDKGLFLEDENADTDDAVPDTLYVRAALGEFNDRVVPITRRELMRRVEKRVARELAATLATYHRTLLDLFGVGALPWLKAFADPEAQPHFRHDPAGISEGLITLHTTQSGGDVDGIEGGFTVTWDSIAGTVPTLVPDPDNGLNSIIATDVTEAPIILGIQQLRVPETDGSCSWDPFEGASRASCIATSTIPHPNMGRVVGPGMITTPSTRTYDLVIDIRKNAAGPSFVTPPSNTPVTPRTRSVIMEEVITVTINISDDVVLDDGVTVIDEATASLTWEIGTTTGNIIVSEIRYRLDPLLELPIWFEPNEWHKFAYAVFSPSYQAGGDSDCTNGIADCVTLTIDGVDVSTDIAMAAIIGGFAETATSQRVTPPAIDIMDYFESNNADPVDTRRVARDTYSTTFNDHVEVLYRLTNPPFMSF